MINSTTSLQQLVIVLTYAQDVEHEPILHALVHQLVWQAVEPDVPRQLEGAHQRLHLKFITYLSTLTEFTQPSDSTRRNRQ